MSEHERRAKKSLLARVFKLIGHYTAPETATGKAFTRTEELLTRGFTRLAQNDLYLNLAGRQMERMFRSQTLMNRWREEWLRTMRMPTTSDVDDVREQVRALHDQVEALGWQLELILEGLEGLKKGSEAPSTGRRGRGSNAQA